MKKVFVVGTQLSYACWIKDAELVNNMEDADIVFFTGGEDINPAIYGAKAIRETYYNDRRDKFEIEMFNKVKPNQLVFGTCRGLQLINALLGGLIIQDVTNHVCSSTHEIHNRYHKYEITSCHHQMVYPYTIDQNYFEILYWASPMSRHYKTSNAPIDTRLITLKGEPEIVLYHLPNKPICLGVQGHPEWMPDESPVVGLLNDLIDKYVAQ